MWKRGGGGGGGGGGTQSFFIQKIRTRKSKTYIYINYMFYKALLHVFFLNLNVQVFARF